MPTRLPIRLEDLLLAVVAAVLTWALVGIYARVMTAAQRLEQPNARSMHKVPVPAGAGIAIVATALVLWPLWVGSAARAHGVLLSALAVLAVISWIDDRRPLSPAVRFGAQAVAVALCLAALDPAARVLPASIPVGVERVALGIGWMWFINLFNFMDGIDGLAGSEGIAIALGYLLVLGSVGVDGPFWQLALIVAAACAGYLVWNWHPARVFMGDAGSIPLGFLLGWLMIDLGLRGHWAPAMIVPLYFAADATLTLFSRALTGKTPWQAHREHFYQRAVLGGASPATVVRGVIGANVVLLALALAAAHHPIAALAAAIVVIATLLAWLQHLAYPPASRK